MTSERRHKGAARAGAMALLRQRDFGLLWWAGLISLSGSWMLRIALPVTVYELTGSATALAGTTAATYVPWLLLGPWAGVMVDRLDRRRVMIGTNIAQAVALLPLLLVRSAADLWIVIAVAFATSAISTLSNSAENALLPRVVDEEHLLTANALNSANNNLARFTGPLLGGAVAVTGGLFGVVLIDVATFAIAAGLVLLVTGRHRAEVEGDTTGHPVTRVLRELREGVTTVTSNRVVLIVFAVLAITQVGEGIFSTLYVVFVSDALGGGSVEFGWLNSAQAVGGVLGGLTAGWFGARLSPRILTGFGLILFGFIDLVIFNYPQWYQGLSPAIVLMIVVGVPSAVSMAAFLTIMQTEVPDRLRGRVFALLTAVLAVCLLAGVTLAGATAGTVDVITMLNIHGATAALAGLAVLVLLRGHSSTPTTTKPAAPPVADAQP
ncbi:MFS transporter, partial [Stackebrandtia soli]|uniref:MFS transporter n=1 Tax=Stackebrandtia soli TaxID=1892856 RepID=UPI0039ED82C8